MSMFWDAIDFATRVVSWNVSGTEYTIWDGIVGVAGWL